MLHIVVLMCLLSFVSSRRVPDKIVTVCEKNEKNGEPGKTFNTRYLIISSVIVDHVKDLKEALSEKSLSGENGYGWSLEKMINSNYDLHDDSKTWCSTEANEACKEKCEDKYLIGNMICITNNFISDLVYCSNGYTSCKVEPKEPESCTNWSYPSKKWPTICPNYCNGESQSPVDLSVTGPSLEFEEFSYINYTPSISTVKIKNNGHSASISWDTSINTPSISGGGLGADYTLSKFHFHWGCENTRGSEHTREGQSFAMEMHLVHYKTSYGNLREAIKHSDGLAVLGVFYNVGSENQALKPITDNLSQITEKGSETDIVFNVSLADLLPSNKQTFYRYQGSLTTPTCNEVVVWSVLYKAVELSQGQIDVFRSLKDKNQASLCDSYREVQPLNGRKIAVFNPIQTKPKPT